MQAADGGRHVPARAKYLLCSSYALAAWAWRSWEFIVALVLIELYPDSLLMVSAYGLMDNLARVLLGPAVGGYIDRHERLPGAHAMLKLQNLCIGGSAAAALVLLWPGSAAALHKVSYWSLMWLLTVLGAASSSGSTGVSISVEREAVKALCGSDSRALAALNSVMRAIDLTALLCAPLTAGVLMTVAGPFVAAAVMAAYCAAAYLPEVVLLKAAFSAAPVLGQPKVLLGAGLDAAAGSPAIAAGDPDPDPDECTGLLAGCEAGVDGEAEASTTARITAITVETDGHWDAQARKAPGRGLAPIGQDPVAESDDDADRGLQGDSPRLAQPLLRGASSSLPNSAPVGWLDSDGDGSDAPTPGRSASEARLLPEGSDVSSPAGRLLSTASSSMTPLAVASPVAATRRIRKEDAAGGDTRPSTGIVWRWQVLSRAIARQVEAYGDSWRVYCRQPVLLLCLALALLYMTVLSLGFLMTSFLKWSGLSEAEVSGYRGIGALTGLAATAIFPPLSTRAGLRFCAVAGVTYQLACLSAGVLPVAAAAVAGGGGLRPSVTQVRILVAGVVSSRTGLWLYDLAVTQLIQENVRQDQLGSVYGVQSSLQASFEMMSFVAGLFSPDPARFHWLMLGSLGSVATAATLVWCYACLRRGRGNGGLSVG